MCWEDDVWYMELMLYPPSTDDAYKVVTDVTFVVQRARWQMMRHWNVINPGDHDYGMDDVKGPEQIVIRLAKMGSGQDRDYMRRNFQIVQHLITGDEEVDPLEPIPKNGVLGRCRIGISLFAIRRFSACGDRVRIRRFGTMRDGATCASFMIEPTPPAVC